MGAVPTAPLVPVAALEQPLETIPAAPKKDSRSGKPRGSQVIYDMLGRYVARTQQPGLCDAADMLARPDELKGYLSGEWHVDTHGLVHRVYPQVSPW